MATPDAAQSKLEAVEEFVRAKLTAAEKAVACRKESEAVWRGGTDESWRKVGCALDKGQRLKLSVKEGRIAAKCQHEVEMFKSVLEIIRASKPNQ